MLAASSMQIEASSGKCKRETRDADGGSIFPHRLAVTRLSIDASPVYAAHIGDYSLKTAIVPQNGDIIKG
jgi:hypothetical protein